MTWKEKLEEIQKKYDLDTEGAETAFEFVRDVMELEVERLEADEPYATNAINGDRMTAMNMDWGSYTGALQDS